MRQQRLTFDAAHVCALCMGERFAQVLRTCTVQVAIEGEAVVEASYYVCDACCDEHAHLGGWLLRRTLLRWRTLLTPTDFGGGKGTKL